VRCRDTGSSFSIPTSNQQVKGRGTEESSETARKLQRTAGRKRKESPTTVINVNSPVDESPSTSADGMLLGDCPSAMDTSVLTDKTDSSGLEQSPELGPPLSSATPLSRSTATPLSEAATVATDEVDCRALMTLDGLTDRGPLTRPGPEQETLRRDRFALQRLQRPLKMKLASPLIYAASPIAFRHHEVHSDGGLLLAPCPSSSSSFSGGELSGPMSSGKRRKVSFQLAQTYPFFGSLLPETTKVVALICLDFLDQADLFSMSAVNSLVE